jgi:hypothetical protein
MKIRTRRSSKAIMVDSTPDNNNNNNNNNNKNQHVVVVATKTEEPSSSSHENDAHALKPDEQSEHGGLSLIDQIWQAVLTNIEVVKEARISSSSRGSSTGSGSSGAVNDSEMTNINVEQQDTVMDPNAMTEIGKDATATTTMGE